MFYTLPFISVSKRSLCTACPRTIGSHSHKEQIRVAYRPFLSRRPPFVHVPSSSCLCSPPWTISQFGCAFVLSDQPGQSLTALIRLPDRMCAFGLFAFCHESVYAPGPGLARTRYSSPTRAYVMSTFAACLLAKGRGQGDCQIRQQQACAQCRATLLTGLFIFHLIFVGRWMGLLLPVGVGACRW